MNLFSLLIFFANSVGAVGLTPINQTDAREKLKSEWCDVSVSFGSYAHGIDSEAYRKVADYIQKSPEVTEALAWQWGKEGERGLCLKTASPVPVYDQLKAFIPAESKRAWIEIKRKGVPPYRTQWPKK